jgi:RNA polymerase sigma-70 factor (sigma-E family)
MAARDEEFSDFVRAAYPRLVRTAFLLCGDAGQAQDNVQEALARTYLAWPRIQDKGALDAYVRRAVVNQTTSWWRRPARRELPGAVPDRPAAGSGLSEVADREVLLPALRALSAGQRAAVVLRYFEDLSEAQTARALGVSVGTVKSQTARGLAGLRIALASPEATSDTQAGGER